MIGNHESGIAAGYHRNIFQLKSAFFRNLTDRSRRGLHLEERFRHTLQVVGIVRRKRRLLTIERYATLDITGIRRNRLVFGPGCRIAVKRQRNDRTVRSLERLIRIIFTIPIIISLATDCLYRLRIDLDILRLIVDQVSYIGHRNRLRHIATLADNVDCRVRKFGKINLILHIVVTLCNTALEIERYDTALRKVIIRIFFITDVTVKADH